MVSRDEVKVELLQQSFQTARELGIVFRSVGRQRNAGLSERLSLNCRGDVLGGLRDEFTNLLKRRVGDTRGELAVLVSLEDLRDHPIRGLLKVILINVSSVLIILTKVYRIAFLVHLVEA